MIILRRLCRGLQKGPAVQMPLVIVRTLKALFLWCANGRPRVRPMNWRHVLGASGSDGNRVLVTADGGAPGVLVSVKLVARII